ncbi:ADP-ribosylglycohydrolase family protein [Lacticaseibacillus daqingensis]|uniref:ADP-ribosylglycohydrolase family protein n=1 Tax=Lacticaseibacillus daqingensis TaxID=2486014 RepID=UPI0013DE65F8|nr:ADP-ribosylglycohydrolase family protein [Lacticaseibacillus daqingensis]
MALTDSRLTHGIIGAAIGDALGLPVQGQTAAELALDPVTNMRSYGTYALPAGVYSDETGLSQASLAALATGFDPEILMAAYRDWAKATAYAPVNGPKTDIWPSVAAAVAGRTPSAPDADPGGLIRTLPLGYYLFHHYGPDLYADPAALPVLTAFVALTNPGPANQLASAIYAQSVMRLLAGDPLQDALKQSLASVLAHNEAVPAALDFRMLTLLDAPTAATMAEAAPTPRNVLGVVLYALQSTTDYASATLAAVNAGHFTDTFGALTGGLAGLGYGYLSIPHHWCLLLTKYGEIVARVRTAERSGNFPRYD